MKFRIASIAALLAGSVATAHAEDGSPSAPATPPTIEQRLQALERKDAVLERKYESDRDTAGADGRGDAVVTANKDGLWIEANDGRFALRFGALIQSDYRDYLGDHGSTQFADQFLLRRVRPRFEGTVDNVIAFRITPDFANGGGTTAGPTSSLLSDAYVELTSIPWAKLRFGKFKSPVGLEQLESDAVASFTERALPTQLVPNRDTGVQVSGDLAKGTISYQAAVLNGVPDGASGETDAGDGKDYEARLFLQPFKPARSEWVNGLGFGVAGSIGDQFGNAAASNLTSGYKTDGQQTFFSYQTGAFANGHRKRISPQGYWYGSHVGLLAEYIASSQEIQRVTTSTATATVTNRAWQIAASWVITGERPSYGGVKPRRSFDPKLHAWGAFEVTGRYAIFRADDTAFDTGFATLTASAKRARAWAAGLNWYASNNVRVTSDYAVTSFLGGAAANQDRPTEKVILSRVQLTY